MNINQFSFDFGSGTGIGTVVSQLSKIFQSKGHNVTVLCVLSSEKIASVNILSADIAKWFIRKLPSRLGMILGSIAFWTRIYLSTSTWRLKKQIVIGHTPGSKVDILVAHSCHLAGIKSKINSGKWSWILNPIHILILLREFWSCKFQRFEKLVAISQSEANHYHELYGIPNDKISVIPNGVDLNRFQIITKEDFINIRKSLDLTPSDILLLFASNEYDRKGLHIAIGALKKVREHLEKAHLLIVGSSNPAPYIKLAKDLGVDDICHFLGHRDDISKLMAASDMLLLLSDYEPFGLVGIESIACGTPVVSTRIGGMLDYIINGENGVFVERTTSEVSKGILICNEKLPTTNEIRKSIRSSAEKYSWESVANLYLRLIHSIKKLT